MRILKETSAASQVELLTLVTCIHDTCEMILCGPGRALMRILLLGGSLSPFILLCERHCALAVSLIDTFKAVHCSCTFYVVREGVPLISYTRAEEIVPELVVGPFFLTILSLPAAARVGLLLSARSNL